MEVATVLPLKEKYRLVKPGGSRKGGTSNSGTTKKLKRTQGTGPRRRIGLGAVGV